MHDGKRLRISHIDDTVYGALFGSNRGRGSIALTDRLAVAEASHINTRCSGARMNSAIGPVRAGSILVVLIATLSGPSATLSDSLRTTAVLGLTDTISMVMGMATHVSGIPKENPSD